MEVDKIHIACAFVTVIVFFLTTLFMVTDSKIVFVLLGAFTGMFVVTGIWSLVRWVK